MKLKTLAIAIAIGITPFAAQADYKVSGDFTVGYFGDSSGDNELKESGSEINFDASEKVGGTTFFGHAEFDFNGSGSFSYLTSDQEVEEVADTITIQEVRVGARGAWGEARFGETDNACDWLDVGGYPDKLMGLQSQGGCKGSDVNNIAYKRTMGAATVAVSHNPNGSEYNAIGVQGKIGPVTASLGYEAGDALGSSDKNVTLGLSGSFGPVSVGLRANRADSFNDTDVGMHAAYTAGANKFYVGLGNDEGDKDSWAAGYNRTIGSNNTFVIEARDQDGQAEVEYGIALIHAF